MCDSLERTLKVGTLKFVQEALKKAVAGQNSKLRQRMVPFARSSLVSTQHKLAILHRAAGGRTLVYRPSGESTER